MNLKNVMHEKILARLGSIQEWFTLKRQGLSLPVYSGYDIRDAGFKAAVVDANIYPAGFNNICQVDKENAKDLMQAYLDRHYGDDFRRVLLLTEEHTANAYYWENVHALQSILEQAGREVRIGIPRDLPEPLQVTSASGFEMTVNSAKRRDGGVAVDDFDPQLIISNNDFSMAYEEWGAGLKTPMNPPREMGWYQRKKSRFFRFYNDLVEEFAGLIEIDPWFLQVTTERFTPFDLTDGQVTDRLAEAAEKMLADIAEKYRQHDIQDEPFLVIKNNSGTYGLAVIQVKSGDDIKSLNYKARKKMKAAKGGRAVSEVILQEGVPSAVITGSEVSEPAIYMIGSRLAGGFLRAHGKKGPKESLNSPGAVYKRLCVSDLNVNVAGSPLENAYGWLGSLGGLAIGLEAADMKVAFPGYRV